MGCTTSQPKDYEHVASVPQNGNYPTPKRQDSVRSARSNGSSKDRRNGSRKGSAAVVDATRPKDHENGEKERKMPPTSDSRYLHLWKMHQNILLDPADIHSTMDSCMTRVTNMLSPTQITFLQRKVRSVVRVSNQIHEKAGRMFRGMPNSLQEQDKSVAEKHHLLTRNIVRKVLPKLPNPYEMDHSNVTEDPCSNQIADNVYLLALFLHESLWDQVAVLAAQASQEAGVVTDVNKYNVPDAIPGPLSPVAMGTPDLPGISLHALTFLISLALSKWFDERTEKISHPGILPLAHCTFQMDHEPNVYNSCSTSFFLPRR